MHAANTLLLGKGIRAPTRKSRMSELLCNMLYLRFTKTIGKRRLPLPPVCAIAHNEKSKNRICSEGFERRGSRRPVSVNPSFW